MGSRMRFLVFRDFSYFIWENILKIKSRREAVIVKDRETGTEGSDTSKPSFRLPFLFPTITEKPPAYNNIKAFRIIERALEDLGNLDKNLSYHSIKHTENVMKTVYDLAVADNLSPRKVELLVVAAAYHDWGYLETSRHNEPIGARKAVWEMIKSGKYFLSGMVEVGRAISATALEKNKDGVLVQNPRTELGKYLCDADLSGFGRPRFFNDSLNVLKEMNGPNISNGADLLNNKDKVLSFLQSTLTMMEAHTYQTPAAKADFDSQKEVNTQRLRDLVSALENNDQVQVNSIFDLMTKTESAEAP